MKNVKSVVKLRRLAKSFAIGLIIPMLLVTTSAFKSAVEDGDKTKAQEKNAVRDDKSCFKSLFSSSYFDPAKPYVTQLNAKAVPFVQNYILQEGANLEKMKIWGKPYFDMYDVILQQYHLPVELKYLSVIESSLISNSTSHSGAVGPWQIMADEAKRMGLKVTQRVDERKNFLKSTTAAARILRELHHQFKDWLLVVAAYNCGAGRVRQAIQRSGSDDFWDMQAYLPEETRSHVKRFIGTHYIFEGNGGLTTMTSSEVLAYDKNAAEVNKLDKPEDAQNEIIEISGKFKALIVARTLGLELSFFNKLNPNFDKITSSGQVYKMRLPKEKAAVFVTNKNNILSQSVEYLLES